MNERVNILDYKDYTNGHTKAYGETPIRFQPHTKNSRQQRKAGSRTGSLFPGRAHQVLVQHQIVFPENIYTSNAGTEQVILRNTHTHVHARKINEKRGYEFKGKQGEVHGRVCKKREGEM